MNIMQRIFELAEQTPQPEPQVLYTVTPFPKCARCREFDVAMENDFCEQCTREQMQGYEVLVMLGRLSNGFESDHGTRYHAVKFGSHKAVCGAQPGRRSVGWTFDPRGHGKEITCPRCIAKLKRTTS
jgi:hypothetical protein